MDKCTVTNTKKNNAPTHVHTKKTPTRLPVNNSATRTNKSREKNPAISLKTETAPAGGVY